MDAPVHQSKGLVCGLLAYVQHGTCDPACSPCPCPSWAAKTRVRQHSRGKAEHKRAAPSGAAYMQTEDRATQQPPSRDVPRQAGMHVAACAAMRGVPACAPCVRCTPAGIALRRCTHRKERLKGLTCEEAAPTLGLAPAMRLACSGCQQTHLLPERLPVKFAPPVPMQYGTHAPPPEGAAKSAPSPVPCSAQAKHKLAQLLSPPKTQLRVPHSCMPAVLLAPSAISALVRLLSHRPSCRLTPCTSQPQTHMHRPSD